MLGSPPKDRSDSFDLSTITGLFAELSDLKRTFSAARTGSVATRMFAEAWEALVGGGVADDVAAWVLARALAAARLGDIDRDFLVASGLAAEEVEAILRHAANTVAGPELASLSDSIAQGLAFRPSLGVEAPAFVAALARQPRAGITCPGKPRILLEPPENHADHCLMVAVYGAMLAPHYRADPGRVVLASLAHHFHNAGMPDSGFTGEVLLGPHLDELIAVHTKACLDQLGPTLRAEVEQAREILRDAATPEGRAFHAADVLDRVLQLNQYTRAAALTPERMLGEMELVHAGPVKPFHDDVLRQAGLL